MFFIMIKRHATVGILASTFSSTLLKGARLKRRLFTTLLFLFCGIYINSFAQVNDAGLWTSIDVSKKLAGGFNASLSEEIRLNENVSEVGTAFTEIGITHKIIKRMTGGISYRFIQSRRLDDSYSIRHRLNVDVAYRIKFKMISATVRERFQSQVKNVQSSDDGSIPVNYLRNKVTFKYDTNKKYTPWISFEAFLQLNNPEGNEFDNLRYSAGFDYKFNKKNSISLFYLINQEINVDDPLTGYITGVNYSYSF